MYSFSMLVPCFCGMDYGRPPSDRPAAAAVFGVPAFFLLPKSFYNEYSIAVFAFQFDPPPFASANNKEPA